MAPARTSNRRGQRDQNAAASGSTADVGGGGTNGELFLEPMMGTPLAMYVEKDVSDRDTVVQLIAKYGGVISPGYSGVPYILVDPHKESGQSLYRQYAGKKGKIVLNARWVHECIKAGALQTFHTNYAGCKVTGTEKVIPDSGRRQGRPEDHPGQVDPSQTMHPQAMAPSAMEGGSVDPLVHAQHPFPYPVYTTTMHTPTRTMQPPTTGPPQSWQGPSAIAPQQTHMVPPGSHMIVHRPAQPYRQDTWDNTYQQTPPTNSIVPGPATAGYDYRYRDEHADWVAGANHYYDPAYDQSYQQPTSYIEQPEAADQTQASAEGADASDKPRGRKRNKTQAAPAAPAATLVANRRNPPARSPTPPTRVIKSTYGGNLFTADDVVYLKKYIDYCQEQGLVLSLREICERIAIKAPHHTFYSWRRYCNKHQIRLGGYVMHNERSSSPQMDVDQEHDEEEESIHAGPGPGTIAAAQQRINDGSQQPRDRSPTPPRALFRSTTGKGVAFTEEDVTFLVRFMEYRKSQGRFDMVAFWKDVAVKAPHHSRASWMKFWRRHKHELNRTEGDEPLPTPPEKKMRYSRADDILLAKYFLTKPEGTSDKIFQAFGRTHPHHPWKGWQEHHRIHKAKIDHYMQKLANNEPLPDDEESAE